MRADLLRDNFEALVKTSEDVKALEAAILNLAVQGKLVPQDPNDEPANTLLASMQSEYRALVAAKEIRVTQKLLPVGVGEQPWPLPATWKWCRLNDIGDWGAGATPRRSEPTYWESGTIPWLKTGELNDGRISATEELVTELALAETSLRLNKPGDVLIAMYGATIGKLGILDIEATTNQACCACTPFAQVTNRYLFFFLLAMRDEFRSRGAGGAQPNISKTKIVQTSFALPPRAEQTRIVVRLDELLARTGELATELHAAEHARARLLKAVLNGEGLNSRL